MQRRWNAFLLFLLVTGCGKPVLEAPVVEEPKEPTRGVKPVDPKLIGVWQNSSDPKEFWTIRPDGTLRWFYQGVPAIGVADSVVAYTYLVDPTKSPAPLDLIHQGVMGTSYFIYRVSDEELQLGVGDGKNRAKDFGPNDRVYKRVVAEPGK